MFFNLDLNKFIYQFFYNIKKIHFLQIPNFLSLYGLKKIKWINCNKLDFFLLLYGKIHFVVNNFGAILHKVLVKSQGTAFLLTYVF